jgi:hypothetical protein
LGIEFVGSRIALRKGNWEEPMTPKRVVAFIGIVAFVAGVFTAQAEQSPDPRVAAGKLRIALGLGSPVLAIKDPKSREVQGSAMAYSMRVLR